MGSTPARAARIVVATLAAAAASLGTVGAAHADNNADGRPHQGPSVTVTAAHSATLPFRLASDGEGLVDLTVSSPGVSWGTAGHVSTVVSAFVDGTYYTDIVIPAARPEPREFFLGHLAAGWHKLTLKYAADRSQGGTVGRLGDIRFSELSSGDADYAVAAHAPILYGRTLTEYGGAFQNAFTDVPLIAWHTDIANADGSHQIWYTITWSNEDGGTGLAPASLMARWGRTTDIEWIYQAGLFRLDVDPQGNVVPGSEYYQSPNHGFTPFAGTYENGHPILQTCTSNNNVCDTLDATAQATPMRFALSAQQLLPNDEAREIMMDRNPWTYWVTSQEMIREGKTEADGPNDTSTPDLSDERHYLFLVLKKATTATQNSNPWIGATVKVTLKDGTSYRSDHEQLGWSIQRDDPAATTVELPAGTTAADIASISVLRVVGNANGDNGGTITVQSIERAMFLGSDYYPEQYFISNYQVPGNVTLTQAAPEAQVWSPGAGSAAGAA
jgi:hypothetical protein